MADIKEKNMIYLLDGLEFNIANVVEFLDSYQNKITSYNGFNMQQIILDKSLETPLNY